MYLLAKCQHNANNNATDSAKWSIEQLEDRYNILILIIFVSLYLAG